MELKTSPDGLHLIIRIDKQLTAADTDSLLRQIALARSALKPKVPSTTDPLEDAGAQVLVEDMPALSIRARAGGGFRLWLRHSGFNWIAYQIDDQTAAGLSNFIRKHIGDGPGVNLVGHEATKRH